MVLKAFLTIVTENQSNKNDAIELATVLKNETGKNCTISGIDQYNKFENSYKIELEFIPDKSEKSELILMGIFITDKICSPWLIYYDDSNNSAEMIFNKDPNSQFRKKQFESIRWGHWQMGFE